MPPSITVRQLIERYPAFLLDAYGVLVDLDGALPGAAAFLAELRRQGKPFWLVSNTAARLPEAASARYRRFGLDIPAEAILTSGLLLAPYFAAHDLRDRPTRVLGPADSVAYVEAAGGRVVGAGADFEVLVLADQAGFPLLETLDELIGTLFARIDAGRPPRLLLPNPDLIYPRAGGFGFTAGGLAVMLEAALSQRYPARADLRFERLGKPHPALFELAVARAGRRDLLMIGDQLETDIRGARDFGLDSAPLLGGVSGARPDLRAGDLQATWLLRALEPSSQVV